MRHGPDAAATGTRATDDGCEPVARASGSNRRQELVRCLRIRVDVSHTIECGEPPHQVVEFPFVGQRRRNAMHRAPAAAAREAVVAHAAKPCFDRVAFLWRREQVRAATAGFDLLLHAEPGGARRERIVRHHTQHTHRPEEVAHAARRAESPAVLAEEFTDRVIAHDGASAAGEDHRRGTGSITFVADVFLERLMHG